MRPAYITAMRSHVAATTPRSWVTNTALILNLSRRSRMSLRIWSWMVTSSAVVGSSASSSFGHQVTALPFAGAGDVPGLAPQPHDRAQRAALAPPGFAVEAHDLTRRNIEVDAIDRNRRPPRSRENRGKAAYLQSAGHRFT